MARILIVDDRAINREYLATVLRYGGHSLLEASDGEEGLECVRGARPDLVITDILMPSMDGYEFVRRIRADPDLAATRIIFYTAHFLEREARALAESCGVLHVISKPVEPEKALSTVEEALGAPASSVVAEIAEGFDREHQRLVTDKLAKKNEELRQANLRWEELLETTLRLVTEQRPSIEDCCRSARQIVGAKYGGIGIAVPGEPELKSFITSGWSAEENAGLPSLREGLLHDIFANNKAMRLGAGDPGLESLGLPANHPHVESLLAVPIALQGRVLGFLYLANKIGQEEFTDGDQRIALSLAAPLAVFYGNARLLQEVRMRAEESERSMEVHKRLEQQFLQAQKMEAVGRLAGGVAHDFNNLLTVIRGYGAALLEDERFDPVAREDLGEIVNAADRAASLTQQLLAFSRRQILQPKILDLNAGIANIEKMLQRVVGEDVQIKSVLAPDLWSVKADPGRMDQILMNLAVNARDAMPDGGRITIETCNVQLDQSHSESYFPMLPGCYVSLVITDTGAGMDAVTKAQIFEPFFTTKGTSGTGLGLSTVYGIVKQSGGFIWVDSELGRGTTFKILLPRVAGQEEVAQIPAPVERRRALPATILLLEDDLAIRRFALKVLTHAGYRVHEFGTPSDAIEFSAKSKEPFDLLISDLVLPEMDGRRAAERIIEKHPEIRLCFMSGYTVAAVMRDGIFEPGTAFLPKPFTSIELLKMVAESLGRSLNRKQGNPDESVLPAELRPAQSVG